MKMRILTALLLAIIALSCNTENTSTSEAPISTKADLLGFEITNIEGTAYQRAVKKAANGKILEEGYLSNGKKSGVWTTYHPEEGDPRISTIIHYVDGKKDGPYLEINNKHIIIAQYYYKNDLLHGPGRTYSYGRVLEVSHYANGKEHGTFQSYTKRGDMTQESNYQNGELHGPFRYYQEGKVTLEYQYENGEKIEGGVK